MMTIMQNGISIMTSPDSSLQVIFNNLSGRNFGGKEYKNYINMMMREFPTLEKGKIQLCENGKVVNRAEIKI